MTTDIDALYAEIDRLNKCLTYEQHRAGRQGTHWDGCHTGGPEHYECALRELGAKDRRIAELEDIDVQPFGEETDAPWSGKRPPTARALAESIAEMATNDRRGLIQRVRWMIVRDRVTTRLRTLKDATHD
jgi:hypothetical protein